MIAASDMPPKMFKIPSPLIFLRDLKMYREMYTLQNVSLYFMILTSESKLKSASEQHNLRQNTGSPIFMIAEIMSDHHALSLMDH